MFKPESLGTHHRRDVHELSDGEITIKCRIVRVGHDYGHWVRVICLERPCNVVARVRHPVRGALDELNFNTQK